MVRALVASFALLSALGCGREVRVGASRARSSSAASTLSVDGGRVGAIFAGLGSTSPPDGGAPVRVTAVSLVHTTDRVDAAPLADESVAFEGTRRDGTRLTSFRCEHAFYDLGELREDHDLVWLRAIDTEAEDGAPPLALVAIDDGLLDDDRPVRVAIDRTRPAVGRAMIVARVLDEKGAPKRGVRAFPVPGASGPKFDDGEGKLEGGQQTGALGVIVYTDVDAGTATLAIPLATEHGGRTWVARVAPNVVTTMVVELDEN
jgi:hypothetical protein